ncbi:MAG: hypothetical protein ACLGSD_14545 [Acidobacteriota bacterium]
MPVETIYIALLNEGTSVWRPIEAERLADGTYLILGPMPEDEEWEFKPRERVIVELLRNADGLQRPTANRKAIEQTSRQRDWHQVEKEVAQSIADSSEPFSPATIANVEDFLVACREACHVPIGVAKGYWSTICVWWDHVEVEIFDDRYEYYHYKDGSTDIEYFEHVEGAEFPRDLMNRLPCRKIDT